jgi:enoyl-CoA hydratase
MAFKNLLFEKKDGIALVTINRPDKLNALNSQTIGELSELFGSIYNDTEVKGVIITGAGDKAFISGADIKEISELGPGKGRKFAEVGQNLFNQIENCPKPVIAAIDGYTLGGGCELAMSCHIRIATDKSSFGQPEVAIGLIPGYGGTQRLPKLVGKGRAFEMILTGERIDAEKACNIGLINRVVDQGSLMDVCKDMMGKIISKAAPLAVAQAIDAINLSDTGEAGYQAEANGFGNCSRTEDFKEGVNAFFEKRKPNFKGE